jgi:DNA-binding CsgD family transcriptional regulator/pimeloyl-ACP methyl ester carboxylesterase
MSALPRLRRTRTTDGFEIAYHVTGQGPPLLLLFPYHVNHLRLNWDVGLHRRGIEFLAQRFTVINLDHRGAGLSSVDINQLTWDMLALDIEAVLAALSIDRVALCAMGPAMMTACAFAASTARHVTNVVAISAGDSQINREILRLRRFNPRIEAILRGVVMSGLDDKEDAIAIAAVSLAALQPATFDLWMRLVRSSRLDAMARSLSAPVLYLHASGDEVVPAKSGHELVRSAPTARLIEVPVGSPMQIWSHAGALDQMTDFLLQGFGLGLPQKPDKRKRPRQGRWPRDLTDREVEVLRLVATGSKNLEIAERLHIGRDTVAHHLQNIFAKTGAANRTEAAIFAHRHGLSQA